MISAEYDPSIFLCKTVPEAQAIILTPHILTTQERWQHETEWLTSQLEFPKGLIVDYGCGIGRLSRSILESNPLSSVLGVDISPTMRRMADAEVADADRFAAITPIFLWAMVRGGLRAQGALAIWTLQHVHPDDLSLSVAILYDVLQSGSPLWTVDTPSRFIPTRIETKFHWVQDDLNVKETLAQAFTLQCEIELPSELHTPNCCLRKWVKG
jgi:SAM-dependent methyltransferase